MKFCATRPKCGQMVNRTPSRPELRYPDDRRSPVTVDDRNSPMVGETELKNINDRPVCRRQRCVRGRDVPPNNRNVGLSCSTTTTTTSATARRAGNARGSFVVRGGVPIDSRTEASGMRAKPRARSTPEQKDGRGGGNRLLFSLVVRTQRLINYYLSPVSATREKIDKN